jgi:hypothetical protein
MADTYTSSLRIAQQEIGANENTWGTINNAALARLDQAIAGIVGISVAGSNITLSTANNADDEARNAVIVLNGTPGATRTITFPNVEKITWVYNNTDSTMTLTSGAGSNVDVLAGFVACIFTDGATNTSALVNVNARISGNIVFPASQNASSNANTLDDYEEGTWTPTLGDGTNNYTLDFQSGHYQKVGIWVQLHGFGSWTSIGSAGASQLRMGGLPFTSSADFNNYSVTLGHLDGVDTTATLNQIVARIGPSGTAIGFARLNDNAGATNLPANSSSASGSVWVGGSYRATA